MRKRFLVGLLIAVLSGYAWQVHSATEVITNALKTGVIAFQDSTTTIPDTTNIFRVNAQGRGSSEPLTSMIFWCTVKGISTNVIVRVEGSPDGAYDGYWTNLADPDQNKTITANGTYGLLYTNITGVRYYRAVVVSESTLAGSPTITWHVTGG